MMLGERFNILVHRDGDEMDAVYMAVVLGDTMYRACQRCLPRSLDLAELDLVMIPLSQLTPYLEARLRRLGCARRVSAKGVRGHLEKWYRFEVVDLCDGKGRILYARLKTEPQALNHDAPRALHP